MRGKVLKARSTLNLILGQRKWANTVTNLIWLGETVVVASSTILEEHTDMVIPIQATYNFVTGVIKS